VLILPQFEKEIFKGIKKEIFPSYEKIPDADTVLMKYFGYLKLKIGLQLRCLQYFTAVCSVLTYL